MTEVKKYWKYYVIGGVIAFFGLVILFGLGYVVHLALQQMNKAEAEWRASEPKDRAKFEKTFGVRVTSCALGPNLSVYSDEYRMASAKVKTVLLKAAEDLAYSQVQVEKLVGMIDDTTNVSLRKNEIDSIRATMFQQMDQFAQMIYLAYRFCEDRYAVYDDLDGKMEGAYQGEAWKKEEWSKINWPQIVVKIKSANN